MKYSNQSITALASKLFHQKQGVRRIKLMHPRRDWLLGILVGVVIMIGMGSWSAYTYFDKRDDIGLGEMTVEAQAPLYKADLVDEALAVFETRRETFNRLTGAEGGVPEVIIELPDEDSVTSEATTTATSSADVAVEPTVSTTEQEIESLTTNLEGNDYYRSHRQIVKAGISKEAMDANKKALVRLVNYEGTNEEYCAKPVL